MYNKVVVPLDGSKLAETALAHVEAIARGCKIPEIFLVSVTEAVKGKLSGTEAIEYTTAKGVDVPVTVGKMTQTASNYLRRIGRQLAETGFKTQTRVLIGNPAEEILHFVEEEGADLIIMASRGNSGFSRWDMGNVAEKVIRAINIPVVLVKPKSGFKETKPRRRGVPS